jgi:hypothetical protein
MAVYPWEAACVKAALESNSAFMPSRIAVARSGISERISGPDPIGAEERAEIENALLRLNLLEKERCGK